MTTRPASPVGSARQQATIDSWLIGLRSVNTRAAYRSDLALFTSWCAQHGIQVLHADTATLVAFQHARVTAGDSESTIRRRWSALSSFYEHAVRADMRPSNPSDGVARPKVTPGDPSSTTLLSSDDVEALRVDAAALDPRLDALVALVVLDGLKVGEALTLDIPHLSLAGRRGVTLVRRGAPTRVAIHPDSARALRRCIGVRLDGPVFVSERTGADGSPRRLTRFGADHLFRQLRTTSTAEPVTANALRRFHITARHLAGDDLEAVREGAGLAHLRSVRRFVDG